jgi:hypothetical protein
MSTLGIDELMEPVIQNIEQRFSRAGESPMMVELKASIIEHRKQQVLQALEKDQEGDAQA